MQITYIVSGVLLFVTTMFIFLPVMNKVLHRPGTSSTDRFLRTVVLAVSALIWIALIALAGLMIYTGFRPPQSRPVELAVPVKVVAKLSLAMETNPALYQLNDILFALPDGHFNQQHRMIRLASEVYQDGWLGHVAWFEVDSLYFDVIHFDPPVYPYYLSMHTDSTGYLLYHRAQYPVRLMR